MHKMQEKERIGKAWGRQTEESFIKLPGTMTRI